MPPLKTADHIDTAIRFFATLSAELDFASDKGERLAPSLETSLKAGVFRVITDLARAGRSPADRRNGVYTARYAAEPALSFDFEVVDDGFNGLSLPISRISSFRWIVERTVSGERTDSLAMDVEGEMDLVEGTVRQPICIEPIDSADQLSQVSVHIGDYFNAESDIRQVTQATSEPL